MMITRHLIRPALLLTALLVLLCAALMALGTADASPPLITGFGMCGDTPCWYGIVPGETPADAANNIVVEHGYRITDIRGANNVYEFMSADPSDPCVIVVSSLNNRVSGVSFYECAIRLGDAMNAFGAPSLSDGGGLYFADDWALFNHRVLQMRGSLLWVCPAWSRARTPAQDFLLRVPNKQYQDHGDYPWLGFMPYPAYERRHQAQFCRSVPR